MKKIAVGAWMLLLMVTAVFSQEIRLNVDNKPLNKVLNMLDMEISFDDKALLEYKVSVARSFKTPEEALYYLLRGKPFAIEKIQNVYVIIPAEKSRDIPASTPFLRDDKINIRLNGEWDVFPQPFTEIRLKEVVVTEDYPYKVNRIVYPVTSLFREGAANAQELLDKIPELHFDKVSNTVLINHSDANILLLVNGIRQSLAYIKNLSPDRIQTIEVIHETSGQFISEGYAAIVNFILKKNYTGYDLYASNFAVLHPSATNAGDYLAVEQPVAGMSYTNHRVNLYGTYSYNRESRNMLSSKELLYNDIQLTSEKAPVNQPNHLFKRHNHYLTGGINFQLAPNHIVGIQGDYMLEDTYTNQNYLLGRNDVSNNRNQSFSSTTENSTKDQATVGTVFYQGKINHRLCLYGDFSYNYYYNDIINEYRQLNYQNGNLYNEYKNHTLLNVEGQYFLSSRTAVNFGYSNIWRQYGSENSHGKGFLDYKEYRNKVFAYLVYHPSRLLSSKFGVAMEDIRTQSRESKNNYWRVLPYAQINYQVNRTVNINMSYTTDQYYPSLYQLSPMSAVVDTFLTQVGNPELQSAIRHQAAVRFSLGERFTVVPSFCYTHDGISEAYLQREYKLYRTFHNIDTKGYNLRMIYEQPLGNYFRLKNQISYYYEQAMYAGIENSVNGWLIHSEVNYYCPEKSLGLQLSYSRNMKKHILWQGYQMLDKDHWLITANKTFWKQRISVMLSYLPPLTWGVRYDQLKEVDTSLYKEKTSLDLKSYNHLLLLRINIRFDHGNIQPSGRQVPVKKEEREKQTIELE